MVQIARRDVARYYLGREPEAPQHGGAERCVIEAHARARMQRLIRVGNVAGSRGEHLGLVGVVGYVFDNVTAYRAHRLALVRRAGGELARPGDAIALLVVIAELIGYEEGRELRVERDALLGPLELDVVVALRVLHDAHDISAIAHVHGKHDRRVVVGEVVVVDHVILRHLELEPRGAGQVGDHVAVRHM